MTPIFCYLGRLTMMTRALMLLRLAAVSSVVTGLVGGAIWFVDLEDRGDGDDLRWGWWHNPLMNFTPFDEPFLEASMWVLLGCSAVIGLGGVMLMAGMRSGRLLVCWQAPISIAMHSVIVAGFLWSSYGVAEVYWTTEALALRLGAVAIDLTLWRVLTSRTLVSYLDDHRSLAQELTT